MLEVVEPGLLTTVQDGGRPDAVDLGVPVGGACDRWSLAVANALLGNAPDAAALEMTLAGATFRALANCSIALAGADMYARVDGVAVEDAVGQALRAGQTLAFSAARDGTGVRTYLALAGGVDVPTVLGSRSTCLVGHFGGLDGRPLRAGDVVRPASPEPRPLRHWPGPTVGRRTPARLRVLPGPDIDVLGRQAFDRLLAGALHVSGRGDRQGMRLDGPALPVPAVATMLSRGVTWGSIQLPPDGQPIVLLADHQTVGGYPVVAVVIRADLPRLGQLGPGNPVEFSATSLAGAQRALREQAAAFASAARRLGQVG